MKWRGIITIAATLVALTVSWGWGLAFRHWPISALHGADEPAAAIIDRVMPHHIVDPATIHRPEDLDLIMAWLNWETVARLAIVWFFWAAVVAAAVLANRRKTARASDARP